MLRFAANLLRGSATVPSLGSRPVSVRSMSIMDPSSEGGESIQRVERSVNQITLLGRTGGVPVMRGSEHRPVVLFSLATHSAHRTEHNQEQLFQRTEWHRIAVFKPGLRAITEKYVRKGARLMIQGRLGYGTVVDKNGNTQYMASIIADDIVFLSSTRAGKTMEEDFDIDEPPKVTEDIDPVYSFEDDSTKTARK